ncbi:MAG: VOC family protein, partial [Chloroflexota bacterium]
MRPRARRRPHEQVRGLLQGRTIACAAGPARNRELGGTEALPAVDWPGIGRGGYLLDPDGNVFGL